jgi:hypothetical protein
MIVKKITTGFVIQTYDTKKEKFTAQEFIAGDEVAWEADGDPMVDGDEPDAYLNFDMVQPN